MEAGGEGNRRGWQQERMEAEEDEAGACSPLGMRWQPGALRAGTGTSAARWGPAQACEGDFSDTQMGVCCHGEGSVGRVLSEPLCTSQLVSALSFAWFAGSSLNTKGQNPNSCLCSLPRPMSPKISNFCH